MVWAPLKESPCGQLQGAFLSSWRKNTSANTCFDKFHLQLFSIYIRTRVFRIQLECEGLQRLPRPTQPPTNYPVHCWKAEATSIDLYSSYSSRLSRGLRRGFKHRFSIDSSCIHLERLWNYRDDRHGWYRHYRNWGHGWYRPWRYPGDCHLVDQREHQAYLRQRGRGLEGRLCRARMLSWRKRSSYGNVADDQ
jgi:hypothetical protein